jgi:AraC-like DNA-binding protein
MSRRNFTRHFRQATGMSFKQWLLEQRLAARALDAGDQRRAGRTGGAAGRLRLGPVAAPAFQAALQTSPAAYRKAFQRSAPSHA